MKRNVILQGHVLDVLKTIENNTFDTIITSPPYWGLRDYGTEGQIWDGYMNCEHEFELKQVIQEPSITGIISDKAKEGQGRRNYECGFCSKCGAWKGELGLEPTLVLYHKHLLQITKELYRVLKPTGLMFWNHGDSYATESGSGEIYSNMMPGYEEKSNSSGLRSSMNLEGQGIPRKSLFMQNYRLIMKMIDEQDWRLRNILVWYKPNSLPSSVKDRFNVDYEPVFMLSKSDKYYFDLDDIRVPHKQVSIERAKRAVGMNKYFTSGDSKLMQGLHTPRQQKEDNNALHPNGKNPGSVRSISTQSSQTLQSSPKHYASFPILLIEPMVKAGCPRETCKYCGKPRERIIEGTKSDAFNFRVRDVKEERIKHIDRVASKKEVDNYKEGETHVGNGIKTIGWTECHNIGYDKGLVLDPFFGSGTTGIVALKNNRDYIGIELNPTYIKIAEKRLAPFIGIKRLTDY